MAAHITAASEGGPGFDASLTSEERKSFRNGIWLCQTCAKLIDSDATTYPVRLLSQWKEQAERRAFAQLPGVAGEAGANAPSAAIIELVLRRYCEDRVLDWETACADPENPDKLTHYVEPHYSLLNQGLRPVDAEYAPVLSPMIRKAASPHGIES